jgi:hypothetical protein
VLSASPVFQTVFHVIPTLCLPCAQSVLILSVVTVLHAIAEFPSSSGWSLFYYVLAVASAPL